jgi:predicted dehydrogenase
VSQSQTRIGLIGAGYIASWHAEALKATPGVTLSAICDRSRGAAEALAAGYRAQVFTSVEEMIAARACDAVHILTPPDLHKALAVQCLEGGLDVLVEKPVALSAEDTREIAEAATRSGRRFHAGHNFLGLPSYDRLKRPSRMARLAGFPRRGLPGACRWRRCAPGPMGCG